MISDGDEIFCADLAFSMVFFLSLINEMSGLLFCLYETGLELNSEICKILWETILEEIYGLHLAVRLVLFKSTKSNISPECLLFKGLKASFGDLNWLLLGDTSVLESQKF